MAARLGVAVARFGVVPVRLLPAAREVLASSGDLSLPVREAAARLGLGDNYDGKALDLPDGLSPHVDPRKFVASAAASRQRQRPETESLASIAARWEECKRQIQEDVAKMPVVEDASGNPKPKTVVIFGHSNMWRYAMGDLEREERELSEDADTVRMQVLYDGSATSGGGRGSRVSVLRGPPPRRHSMTLGKKLGNCGMGIARLRAKGQQRLPGPAAKITIVDP